MIIKMNISKNIYDKLPKVVKNLLPVIIPENIPKNDINRYTSLFHLPRIRQDIGNWRASIMEAEMPYVPHRVKMQVMFEDTALNGHVTACVEKRKNQVLLKNWNIQDEKGKINDEWTKYFQSVWFSNLLSYTMDAIFYGYSFLNWTAIKDNKLVGVKIVRRQFISPDRRIIVQYPYSLDGKVIDDNDIADWTMYVDTPTENGKSPCGFGLFYKIAVYEIFLRNLLGQEGDYCELFGAPTRVARTNKTSETERGELERSLEQMGSAGYIILDELDKLELVERKDSGTGSKIYDTFANKLEKLISKVLLGHGDAIDSTPGKLGSGGNKDDSPAQQALIAIEKSDVNFCTNWVNNEFIPKLRNLGINIPVELKLCFLNDREEAEADKQINKNLLDVSTYVNVFKQAGYQIDIDWLAKKSAIPMKAVVIPVAPGNPANEDSEDNPVDKINKSPNKPYHIVKVAKGVSKISK